MPQANKTGFIQGHSFAGFLQIEKKMLLKICASGSNGAKNKNKK